MDGGYYPAHAKVWVGADKFDYQDTGIDEIRGLMKQGFRGITYIAPTGSGKSFVTAKLARLTLGKGRQFRYIAPRKLLVSGVSEKLDLLGIEHAVRMSGVPWQGGRQPDVQAWCIQSFFNHLKSFQTKNLLPGESPPKAQHVDLFVVDEGHTYQPAIRKLWQLYPRSRFVYLTATPLPGMDKFSDAVVDGPSVEELQSRGILVPIRYKTYQSDGNDVEALRGEIVSTWKDQGEDRKTVVFCKNRKEAKYIQEKFCFHGMKFEYMDANTPQTERDAIRDRIRIGESKGVVNVEVMGYGVDWPFIDCVVLAYVVEAKLQDNATRLAEYIQKVGRGIRACEGKEDLVVIDHTGTYWLFGRVEQEIDWSIDSDGIKETAERVRKKAEEDRDRKDPPLITCEECGHNFIQLAECPVCDAQVSHQHSDAVQHVPATIAEINHKTGRHVRKPKPVSPLWTKESAHQTYAMILWCIRNKRKKNGDPYSDGMAFHVYERLKTGIKPPFSKATMPIEADPAMKEWVEKSIKSHNAHWAIKNKHKAA